MCKKLHYFPIAVCITIPLNFVITYVWAVLLGHVEAGFPYISDTGSLPPESCFFSFMLNISALLLMCCVYIQYLNIGEILIAHKECGVPHRLNASSAWIGIGSCFGLSVVASFQEFNVFVVHLMGAAVCFVGAVMYLSSQTWFSSKLRLYRPVSRSMLLFRVVLCCLCLVLLIITFAAAVAAITMFNGESKLQWRQQDGGWEWHLVSSISEWLMSLVLCVFILTFTKDFKHISIARPVTKFETLSST